MTDYTSRDLTLKVFDPPVAGTRQVLVTGMGMPSTLKEMFKKMALQMKSILKERHATGTVGVEFNNSGHFVVLHGGESYELMALTDDIINMLDSMLQIRAADPVHAKGVSQLLLLFFQVVSMMVYEIVIGCLSDKSFDLQLIEHLRETVHHMVIMMFIMIAPAQSQPESCGWRALFKKMYEKLGSAVQLNRLKKLLQHFEMYFKARPQCLNDLQKEKTLKKFADTVLLILGNGIDSPDELIGRMQTNVEALIPKKPLPPNPVPIVKPLNPVPPTKTVPVKPTIVPPTNVPSVKPTIVPPTNVPIVPPTNLHIVHNPDADAQRLAAAKKLEAEKQAKRDAHILSVRKKWGEDPVEYFKKLGLALKEARYFDTMKVSPLLNVIIENVKNLKPIIEMAESSKDARRIQALEEALGLVTEIFDTIEALATNIDTFMHTDLASVDCIFETKDPICASVQILIAKYQNILLQLKEIHSSVKIQQDHLLTIDRTFAAIRNSFKIIEFMPDHIWNNHIIQSITAIVNDKDNSPFAPQLNPWMTRPVKGFSDKDAENTPVSLNNANRVICKFLQKAFIRSESIYRSFPCQIFMRLKIDDQDTQEFLCNLLYHENNDHVPHTNNSPQSPHSPPKRDLWNSICLNIFREIQRKPDQTLKVDQQTQIQRIIMYMKTTSDYVPNFNRILTRLHLLHSLIDPPPVKTLMFINGDGNNTTENPRFVFDPPGLNSSFFRLNYAVSTNVLTYEDAPQKESTMIVGPLGSFVSGTRSFEKAVDALGAQMNPYVEQLNQKPMIIMGYGASGSGKTTCLFGLAASKRNGVSVAASPGLLDYILAKLPTNFGDCQVTCYQYYHYDYGASDDLRKNLAYVENLRQNREGLQANLGRVAKSTGTLDRIKEIFERNEHGEKKVDLQFAFNSHTLSWNDSIGTPMTIVLKKHVEVRGFRQVAPTFLNNQSSRSHVIMQLKFINCTHPIYIADFAGVENLPLCEEDGVADMYREVIGKDGEDHKPNYYDETQDGDPFVHQFSQMGGDRRYFYTQEECLVETTKFIQRLGSILRLPSQLDFTPFRAMIEKLTDKNIMTQYQQAYIDGIKLWYTDKTPRLEKGKDRVIQKYEMETYAVRDLILLKEVRIQYKNLYSKAIKNLANMHTDGVALLVWCLCFVTRLRRGNLSCLYLDDCFFSDDEAMGAKIKGNADGAIPHTKLKQRMNELYGKTHISKFREFENVTGGNIAVMQSLFKTIQECYGETSVDPLFQLMKKALRWTCRVDKIPLDGVRRRDITSAAFPFCPELPELQSALDLLQLDTICDGIYRKREHGRAICRFRVSEGRMINLSLEKIRDLFATKYGSEGMPNIQQDPFQSEVLSNQTFGDKKQILPFKFVAPKPTQPILVVKKMKDILEENPNVVILGVFNNAITRDNPPAIDYIPCSDLIQEYKRLQWSDLQTEIDYFNLENKHGDARDIMHMRSVLDFKVRPINQKTIEVFTELVSEFKNTVDPSKEQRIQRILGLTAEASKTIRGLADLIAEVTQTNGNTSTGTLEFIDQACKCFSTNQTFVFNDNFVCHTLKQNLLLKEDPPP